jgi:hypothetical protein
MTGMREIAACGTLACALERMRAHGQFDHSNRNAVALEYVVNSPVSERVIEGAAQEKGLRKRGVSSPLCSKQTLKGASNESDSFH